MSGNEQTCPTCGAAATRKDGYDRRGGQRIRCRACRCRFTATTGTPFAGYRFPPDVIALAVRWYLRFRLSYADVAELLAGRDLRGTVTTVDALLTQRALAAQVRRQRGHYLMLVKENQPELYLAIRRLFTAPPPPLAGDRAERVTTTEKGHGRLETRTPERSAALTGQLDWPDVGQVLRRTYRAVELATGAVSQEVTDGVTGPRPEEAPAAAVEALWRGHWTIEARVHYVRDATLGEDAGQQRVGSTPQALAALRNALLSLLRSLGWASIADALRHYGAYARRALALLGALPAGL